VNCILATLQEDLFKTRTRQAASRLVLRQLSTFCEHTVQIRFVRGKPRDTAGLIWSFPAAKQRLAQIDKILATAMRIDRRRRTKLLSTPNRSSGFLMTRQTSLSLCGSHFRVASKHGLFAVV
jgi:hypothetical protein